MGHNERVMTYDDNGKPKPGGKLLADPFFLAVPISFCNQCKRVKEKCNCPRPKLKNDDFVMSRTNGMPDKVLYLLGDE